MELINGVIAQLGVTELEPGKYTQMRLYLGDTADNELNILDEEHPFLNYVIDEDDDEIHELKVPSGYQSGIKLVHEFEIVSGLTELVLDFDASASVVKAGKSGKYLLKPTIKVIDTKNNAALSGTVNEIIDDQQQAGLAGAWVSAQVYTAEANDGKDQVLVYTSTLTAADDELNDAGEYAMYLPPGTYTIVAYKDGFLAGCANVTLALDEERTIDFALTATTDPDPIMVTVNVSGIPDDDQKAIISFRKEQACTNAAELQIIEVANLIVGNGTGYTIKLPSGNYTVVSSTDGKTTLSQAVAVAAGMADLNITFP